MKDLNKADIEAIILSESWEVRATLRAMVRRSLYLTAKMLVSYNEPRNTMTAEVFKERQDWLQWIVCEKKRGLLEDPRSYVKTTGSTRTIPVWCSIQRGDDRYDHPNELARIDAFLMQHPHLKGTDMRLAIAGDTKKAATRFTGAVRRFYLTNPFFRFLFPELNWENPLRTDYGSFNDEEMYLPGRLQPELPGAFLTAFGTETAIVGGRLDGLIVSDLVGDHNWRSSGEMNRLRDWLKTAPALLSHRDPRQPYGGFVLVEENRWTLDDVNSLIHNEYTEWDIWRRGVFRCYVHGVGNCGRWGSDETKDCAPTEQSLWPEGPYRDAEALARLRQEEGEAIFCNPGEAPILMSDWTQRRLDEVKVGDEVVGFEPVATGKRAKLVKATVLAVGSRVAPVVKVTFSDGSVIRCTPEHKFYTGRLPDKGSSQTARKLYDVPRAGRRFVRVVNDWLNETDNSEWHYLAGILDGEGSLKHTNITITQVEEVNGCVVERIDRCLSALKIPHLRKKYKRTDDKTWRNGQNVPLTWVLNSDRDFMSRLLTRTAIGKKQQIVDRMWKHPGRLGLRKEGQQNGRIKVTSIEPAGVEREIGRAHV